MLHAGLKTNPVPRTICLGHVLLLVMMLLPGCSQALKCFPEGYTSSIETPNTGPAIGLQVTNRSTHQVMTRIFYIFLKEILNYKDVRIIPIHFKNSSDPYNPWYTLDFVRSYNGLHNIGMINLEVWMPYSTFRDPPENIFSAGASITPGRYSWFVPKAQVSRDSNNCSLHYDVFKDMNNEHYNKYVMDDDLIHLLSNRSTEEYRNPKCAKFKCGILVAEYRSDSIFIEKHLDEIYLNVIWLGDYFKDTVKELAVEYEIRYPQGQKRFLVLHWMPSEVIDAEVKFVQITLPRCEDYRFLQNSNCIYELTSILKYYARSLAGDRQLMFALRNFYISDKDLGYIQDELSTHRRLAINSESAYDQVACNWLLSNNKTYSRWIITKRKSTLSIGGIFPINITDRGHQNIIGAAQKAISAINEDMEILPDYHLELMVNDGHCKSDMVMKAFIHYYNVANMLGVLGPACSETVEPIAGISKHLNMVVMSYSAESGSFVDRNAYPYFFRTIGSNSEYVEAYVKIMQRMGWSRISVLIEDSQEYVEYTSRLESMLRVHNFTLAFSRKFPSDVTISSIREHLGKLKEAHSRIIIAELHGENAAKTLCEAIHLGMTQLEGYVWFLPAWILKDFHLWSSRVNYRCTAEQLKNAIEGHFSIRHSPFGPPKFKMREGVSIENWRKSYRSEVGIVSNYVGFVYDAVWAYALAAHKLLQKNVNSINTVNNLRSKEVADKLANLIWQTDFDGLSGKVRFGQGEFGGSRIIDLDIMKWRNMSYEKVGSFKPNVEGNGTDMHINGGNMSLNLREMFNTNIPEDGRYDCGFSGLARPLHLDCDVASLVFSILMCFLAIALMSLVSFYFWKQRYNRKVEQSAQIMKMFGIDLISPSRNKVDTLDKWELPRENVVVNRRLGQGAFGTVYGGEALLGSGDWTAVAVKTLKAGASTEDRLDFLAEAEAMKKFNHKNVIKLLGVCLQKEPIYTIMEFMLYGDLKTYLLARRNMVNEKITDESDISSKRLTMYAMDVARGLAYLAEQKYVHRDIACRNCLVNSQRIVKIGDFGMARPTSENDYYCFNRKSVRKLFPVRWMPPETLSLGIFTTASDIWSFGVVLFEMITFGSYPYQGMTNNQVLDFVRNGNTLQVPSGVKPQLEGLLKACWSQDACKRPRASEIIDYISNFPRLLSPSLDFPGTAVQISESNSDDIDLLPNGCKRFLLSPESKLDILPPIITSTNITNFCIIDDDTPSRPCDSCDPRDSSNRDMDSVNSPVCSEVSFSATTPDGYSIMAPLLKYQVGSSTSSSNE